MFGVTVGAFHFELLDGLFAAAESHGHNLIISPLTKSRDEDTAARSLQGFRFDALIMLSPPTSHPLLAGRIPLAVVGWHVDHPQVDVVRTDDERGHPRGRRPPGRVSGIATSRTSTVATP